MLTVAEAAAHALQVRIRNGVYPPGSVLPSQRQLAQELAISRASLREAISTLEALGFIYSRPGKGVFVRDAGGSDASNLPHGTTLMTPDELLEFRLVLEPVWAALAAQRRTVEALDELESLQSGMEAALQVNDLVTAANCDLGFHLALAVASGNPGLSLIGNQFRDQIAHSLRLPFSNPASRQEPVDEHRKILAAIRNRDSGAAYQAMCAHLAGSANRLGIHIRFVPPTHCGTESRFRSFP